MACVAPQRFRGKLRITGQKKQPFGLRAEVKDLPVKTGNDQALFLRVRELDVEIAHWRQGVRNIWHDQLQSFWPQAAAAGPLLKRESEG